MGKWLARLAALEGEESSCPPSSGTDKTDRRGVLSVLAVGRQGGEQEVSDAGETRAGLADRSARVRARLLRWGWPVPAAEALAERLARRDADPGGDERVSCAGECVHYRPGCCGNHRRAGLPAADVGRDLAGLPQRCPGFQSER